MQQPPVYAAVGPKSCRITCPSCRASILTRVDRKTINKAHITALVLILIGCVPCCLIPYCMDSCKNIDHYCPNCSAFIGTYYN
ncbi:LITAF-like zinc ribbon domain-containing protein [Phthorimaea operculella]|nr:LITAF-like zinc ribbon domain-containing protein [Phthorimaea operculella]